MSKQTREFYESQPERYRIEKGGAVKDLTTNLWVDALPELNPHAITKENSAAMHARRGQNAKLAEMRALARKAGVDVDNATLEELAKGEGTAYEALVGHGYDLAMSAKTPRGFEGVFSQFRSMVGGDPKQSEARAPSGQISAPPAALLELARQLEDEIAKRIEQARAIDAESLPIEGPRED